jgi:hypothetical protein
MHLLEACGCGDRTLDRCWSFPIHLNSYHWHTAILPNSLFTHLEFYIKMYEFHPNIMQKKLSTGIFLVSVWLTHKNYFQLMLHQQKVKVSLERFYSCCWTLQKFSLHTDTADYLRQTGVFYVASYTVHYYYFILMLVLSSVSRWRSTSLVMNLHLPQQKTESWLT